MQVYLSTSMGMSQISDKKLSLSMYLCKHAGTPSSLFHCETLNVELGWKVTLVGSPSHQIFYIKHYQDEGSGSNTTLIQHHVTHTPIPCQKTLQTPCTIHYCLLCLFSAVPDILWHRVVGYCHSALDCVRNIWMW